jgi:hypothetical protein
MIRLLLVTLISLGFSLGQGQPASATDSCTVATSLAAAACVVGIGVAIGTGGAGGAAAVLVCGIGGIAAAYSCADDFAEEHQARNRARLEALERDEEARRREEERQQRERQEQERLNREAEEAERRRQDAANEPISDELRRWLEEASQQDTELGPHGNVALCPADGDFTGFNTCDFCSENPGAGDCPVMMRGSDSDVGILSPDLAEILVSPVHDPKSLGFTVTVTGDMAVFETAIADAPVTLCREAAGSCIVLSQDSSGTLSVGGFVPQSFVKELYDFEWIENGVSFSTP